VLLAGLVGYLLAPRLARWLGAGQAPAPAPKRERKVTIVPRYDQRTPTATAASLPQPAQAWPAGLPLFSSAAWRALPAKRVTSAIVERAWALLPTLREGQGRLELAPGGAGWLYYRREPHAGGKSGVTVYEPRPAAAPAAAPGATMVRAAAPVSSQPVRTLRQGMSGPDVAAWQRTLGVAADGIFGPRTATATAAWQAAHGLTADGVVGPRTWAAAGAVLV
jgi:hypothetical protein